MLHDQIDQIVSSGDLHVLHDADRQHASDILDLIATELADTRTRIVRVIAPEHAGLGLAELIAQMAGHPPSPAGPAQAVTDNDVERGHLTLTWLNQDHDRILLMVDGAQRLQPAALRYIQQACRIAPYLRIAFAGSDGLTTLLDTAEFAPLHRRPVTELHLEGRAINADVCLAAALLSLPWVYGARFGAASIDTEAPPAAAVEPRDTPTLAQSGRAAADNIGAPTPRWPLQDAPRLAASGREGAGLGGRFLLVVLGVVGLIAMAGSGGWLLSEVPVRVSEGTVTRPATVTHPAPGAQPVPAETSAMMVPPIAPANDHPANDYAAAAADNRPEAAPESPPVTPLGNSTSPAIPTTPPDPVSLSDPPTAPVPETPVAPTATNNPTPPVTADKPDPPPDASPPSAADKSPVPPEPAPPNTTQVLLTDAVATPQPSPETASVPAPAPPAIVHDSAEASSPPPGRPLDPAPPNPLPGNAPAQAQIMAAPRGIEADAPQPTSAVAPQAAPAQPTQPAMLPAGLPAGLAEMMVRRADVLLQQGNVSAARLLYERAADAGSGTAATAMGKTFDPVFLAKIGVVGLAPDPTQAAAWYGRALALGDAEARIWLQALERTTNPAAVTLEKRP